MNKEQRLIELGQRFTIGFPSTELDRETLEVIRRFKIGNIILFKNNVQSRSQLKELCSSLRDLILEETGIAPFIMIDQEGGMVTRLSDDFVNIPGAMAIRATGNSRNARFCGQVTAKELSSVGVNFDLAPVLDINSNPNNPVVGVRSYGEDSLAVSEFGIEMMRGLADFGLMTCGKHFPGHGDTSVDSHMGLPVVNKTLSQLEKLELCSFENAIKAGIPAIMTTHILFPNIDDSGLPATMNRKILVDILRGKLKFEGIVLTDCMEMGAIAKNFGTVPAIQVALKNGVDIACVSHHGVLAGEAAQAIMDSDSILDDEMELSFRRILSAKSKCFSSQKLSEGASEEDRAEVDRIGRSSITICNTKPVLGQNPLFVGCYPFVVTLASNPENNRISFADYMASRFHGASLVTSTNPDEAEIANVVNKASGYSSIVMGTYNGHVYHGQIKLGLELLKLGVPMTVAALRNPYDLSAFPDSVNKIAAYEYTQQGLSWVASCLSAAEVPASRQYFTLEVTNA